MSSINPNNINGQYPIAGQDNDSQGFRDNFTNIKNNFTFSKSEIEDLQNNAILKSPLAGGVINNDLSYNELIAARLRNTVETIYSIGVVSTNLSIDWTDGHFQKFTLDAANITVTFDKTTWPTSGYWTKLRLQITVGSTARTVTLSTATVNWLGLDTIEGNTGTARNVFNLEANTTYLFEFSTHDKGDNVTVVDLLRNRASYIVDYQYLTPANASIANVSPAISTVIIEPATAIDEANIAMPGNTQVVDGHTISFAFGNTITAVTHYGNGATILGGLTTATVTTDAKFIFKSSTNTWYRLG